MPYIDGNTLALILVGMLLGSILTLTLIALFQMWFKGEE